MLTVGAVQAGRDNNVIPASAELRLNLRWFDRAVREKMLKQIDEINKGIVIGAGLGEDKVPVREMKGSAGPLKNNTQLASVINPSLTELLGAGKLIDQFPAVMGSEDFQEAFFQNRHTLQLPPHRHRRARPGGGGEGAGPDVPVRQSQQ